MKVKCIYNSIDKIPDPKHRDFLRYENELVAVPSELIIGKEYVVYALSQVGHSIFYHLFEEERCDMSPFAYNADFFEVVDPRVSKYWIYQTYHRYNNQILSSKFAYPEWVNDPMHQENLVDGYKEEMAIFQRYKALMDTEFDE